MTQSRRPRASWPWWFKGWHLVFAVPAGLVGTVIVYMWVYILAGEIFEPGVLTITVENRGRDTLKGGRVYGENKIFVHKLGPVEPHSSRVFTFRDIHGSDGGIDFTFADSSSVETHFTPPEDRDTARVKIVATTDSITGEVPYVTERQAADWWYSPVPAGRCDTCAVRLPGAAVRKKT